MKELDFNEDMANYNDIETFNEDVESIYSDAPDKLYGFYEKVDYHEEIEV